MPEITALVASNMEVIAKRLTVLTLSGWLFESNGAHIRLCVSGAVRVYLDATFACVTCLIVHAPCV